MRLPLTLGTLCVAALGLTQTAAPADTPGVPDAASVTFAGHIAPLLKKHCTKCHGGDNPRAGLALDVYKDEASVLPDRKVWEKVVQAVRAREMPPRTRPKLTQSEIDLLTNWIDGQLVRVDCGGPRDPGRVTIRRLNRAEYNNTIRDLVGVAFRPADDFPSDDVGYGFDNIGDVLSMPPILMEKYLAAAEKIVELAFADPQARKRILIEDISGEKKLEPTRRIVESFTRRAYRRPVRPDEVNRLMRLVEVATQNGDSVEAGIQLAVQAVLVSPHFLFRVEMDRQPRNAVQPVSEFELASRLSYFVWSSMPDETLFDLARAGKLRQAGNLEAQVRRMLRDPKAKALVENFAGQWLQTRNLKGFTPEPDLFPTFDEGLRSAMLRETELFFEAIVREDRSILDFLDADFTFVNERLARHYGIEGVQGPAFRRVRLTGGPRGGILTQASILTLTSNPTRTSPVKRGKWILENILGTPPPPPPPDAGELSEDKKVVLSGSLRQRMEQHRANPNCATCHQRMDPLGFGFENFDAIGAWRERDGAFPIDPGGVLPGGETFKGPKELKAILKTKDDLFRRCLGEKLLTYALGRGLEHYDKCAVDDICAAVARDGQKFTSLVMAVVKSDPFQKRRVLKRGQDP